MKLFVVLSVLLVSALVAANPVAVQEAQTREDRVVQSGSFESRGLKVLRFGIQEDYVITSYTITLVEGQATWTLLSGGIGANFISILVTQPLTIPLLPRYKLEYEIRGQPGASTLNAPSDFPDKIDIEIN